MYLVREEKRMCAKNYKDINFYVDKTLQKRVY